MSYNMVEHRVKHLGGRPSWKCKRFMGILAKVSKEKYVPDAALLHKEGANRWIKEHTPDQIQAAKYQYKLDLKARPYMLELCHRLANRLGKGVLGGDRRKHVKAFLNELNENEIKAEMLEMRRNGWRKE